MLYLILIIAITVLIYVPQWWVRHVIKKHQVQLDNMPGTGAELAQHLIQRFDLNGVTVKKTTKDRDFYSPSEKVVGLSPEVYDGKSLSAVAIAAHEVGHAIQYHRKEPVSRLRGRYTQLAHRAQSLGIAIITLSPVLGILTKVPAVMFFIILAGVVAMLASVALHAMILPEEYDASFAKALPILNEGYVPEEYMPAIRQVLKACVFTYVAGALADILSIWRWLAILR